MPIKELADRSLAALGIIVLLPVLIAVSIAIFLDDPGTVMFRQTRAGREHEPFTIYKFRTMRRDAPHLSTEEMRRLGQTPYTRLGPFLRRTSLDELPQLFNVLSGDMSLIGPRPALMTQHVVLRGREELGIHHLRPGMTGLAQITGRDDLTDVEKIQRDNLYLSNIGPMTDLFILVFTFRRISASKGAY